MRHRDYVERRAAQSPEFETYRALAKADLDLALVLQQRRESLGLSPDDLTRASGIPVDRLEAIEEGDTTTLAEVLRLSHALGVRITVDSAFGVRVTPADEAGMTA